MVIRKYLCPNCKTGQQTYENNQKEPMCPYILHHNGRSCRYFVPIKMTGLQKWINKLKKRKKENVSNPSC